jgi:hypothetical protein
MPKFSSKTVILIPMESEGYKLGKTNIGGLFIPIRPKQAA